MPHHSRCLPPFLSSCLLRRQWVTTTWLRGTQVWDSVRMNNIAQHFATAWFRSKLSTSEEERAHFQKFLATSFASRDSERESAEQWLGFDATKGRHPGLTLRKRAAGS
jgi:hypothetical protein|eukprot:COSAG02_NODE_630_length_19310_cov_19.127271_8_plen_108_part_00